MHYQLCYRPILGRLGPQLFPGWEDSTQWSYLLAPEEARKSAGPDVPVSATLGNPRLLLSAGEGARTLDNLIGNQALYQTELHPHGALSERLGYRLTSRLRL